MRPSHAHIALNQQISSLLSRAADYGRLEFDPSVLRLTSNSTWLTHWGLHKTHNISRWRAAHRPGLDIVIPTLTPAGLVDPTPLAPWSTRPAPLRTGQLFFGGSICGSRHPPVNRTCGKQAPKYSALTRQRVRPFKLCFSAHSLALSPSRMARVRPDMWCQHRCTFTTGIAQGINWVTAVIISWTWPVTSSAWHLLALAMANAMSLSLLWVVFQ
jgi:hypothetical protein